MFEYFVCRQNVIYLKHFTSDWHYPWTWKLIIAGTHNYCFLNRNFKTRAFSCGLTTLCWNVWALFFFFFVDCIKRSPYLSCLVDLHKRLWGQTDGHTDTHTNTGDHNTSSARSVQVIKRVLVTQDWTTVERYNTMRSERCSTFFVLLTTLCVGVVHGEVDKDVKFDVESVRRQLIADIDNVVKCRRIPGWWEQLV